MFEINEIQSILPQLSLSYGRQDNRYCAGIKDNRPKNVTINEPFFEGHFPGNPIMPGVLIVEAMAR